MIRNKIVRAMGIKPVTPPQHHIEPQQSAWVQSWFDKSFNQAVFGPSGSGMSFVAQNEVTALHYRCW